jgi:F1F0 ATPase subunit 2
LFWIYILLSFAAGGLLGAFFFGGLWWTVQKISGVGSPYLVVVISFFIRAAIAMAGFYYLLMAGWQYMLAAMIGFIVARSVLAYKLKPGAKMSNSE